MVSVSYLEITEVVLVHCNIVNNTYIHLFLINITTFDQNSKPLEIKDKINITLVIN